MSAEPPVPPKTPLVPPVVVAYAFAFGLCVLAVLAGVVCRVMLGPSPFMALAAAALPLLGAHYLLVSNVLRGKSLGLRFGASLGTLAAAGGITAGLFYVLFEPTALVWNNYPNFFGCSSCLQCWCARGCG